jgi:hypothetical protein
MIFSPHNTSRLAIILVSSLPSMPASALRAVGIAMRIAASWLRPALWGLRIRLSEEASPSSYRRPGRGDILP